MYARSLYSSQGDDAHTLSCTYNWAYTHGMHGFPHIHIWQENVMEPFNIPGLVPSKHKRYFKPEDGKNIWMYQRINGVVTLDLLVNQQMYTKEEVSEAIQFCMLTENDMEQEQLQRIFSDAKDNLCSYFSFYYHVGEIRNQKAQEFVRSLL
jgi:hypothetical protein